MRWLPVIALACLFAGCAGLGGRDAHRYYVLEALEPASPAPTLKQEATLLVAPTTAAGFYDTQEIVFSPSAGTRAYYQFSSWTEPPARRLGALLVPRLERGGAFRVVAAATGGVRGTLLLRTDLEEMYHDAAMPPGSVRITLTAELSDPAKRTLLARRTFVTTAPVASHDASGAVQGFRRALGTLLDEIAAWVASAAGG